MSLGLSEFRESTKPLLRPAQVAEMEEERSRLDATLQAPNHHRNQVQDKIALSRATQRIQRQLDAQAPKAYAPTERDAATRRLKSLEATIVEGMPTQAEMRRNPAGAVGKHMRWEAAKKKAVAEWQNIRLRMHATESGSGPLGHDPDIANIELLRPQNAGHELNMHNEQIPGRVFYEPPGGLHIGGNLMSEDDRAAADSDMQATMRRLAETDPRYARALAAMEERAAPAPQPAPKAKGSHMSAEARQRMSERMKQQNADRKAAKAAAAATA